MAKAAPTLKTADRSPLTAVTVFLSTAVLFLALGSGGAAAIGCGVTGLAAYVSLFSSNRPLPLRWLITSVAGLQWIVVPALVYLKYGEDPPSPMLIPEKDYMYLAVPALIALALGLRLFSRLSGEYQRKAISDISANLLAHEKLIIPLLSLSVVGTLGRFVALGEVGFILYLLSTLKFAAALIVLIGGSKWKVLVVFLVFSSSLVEAAASGLFHDFLLWATVLFLVACYRYKVGAAKRLISVLVAVLAVASLQTVKGSYRGELAVTGSSGDVGVYAQLTATRAKDIVTGNYDAESVYDSTLERLNQGAIITSVVRWMSMQEFAGGVTIYEGLLAALVPRVLAPNKATAGGQKTFEAFTGRRLNEKTSMGVSLLGEGYGNFGFWGAIIFMALYGAFMAALLRGLEVCFEKHSFGVVLLPTIFLHAIKAETDFVTTFNHVIKASLLFLIMYFLLVRYLHVVAARAVLSRKGVTRGLPGGSAR